MSLSCRVCVWYARSPTAICNTHREGHRLWHAPPDPVPETNSFLVCFILRQGLLILPNMAPNLQFSRGCVLMAGMTGIHIMPAPDSYFFNKAKQCFFSFTKSLMLIPGLNLFLCFQVVQTVTCSYVSLLKLGPHFQSLSLSLMR